MAPEEVQHSPLRLPGARKPRVSPAQLSQATKDSGPSEANLGWCAIQASQRALFVRCFTGSDQLNHCFRPVPPASAPRDPSRSTPLDGLRLRLAPEGGSHESQAIDGHHQTLRSDGHHWTPMGPVHREQMGRSRVHGWVLWSGCGLMGQIH